MTSSPNTDLPIICDWLDVTFAPTDCPSPDLNLLLMGAGFSVTRAKGGSRLYLPPGGLRGALKIEERPKWARVSASGGVCSSLRSLGIWEEYLSVLGGSPHKVSRVDAALDLPLDGADVIVALVKRYPEGKVNLSRKALSVTRLLSVREDGRESGTFYVGREATAARFTARVYDKSLEMLERHGEVIPTTTRFEVTACKDCGATLRDAALPEAIFWHIAAPALLSRPEGVPMWVPNQDLGWSSRPPSFNPAETLQRRVEASAELEAFLQVADAMGPSGRVYLLHLIQRRLGGDQSSEGAPEPA